MNQERNAEMITTSEGRNPAYAGGAQSLTQGQEQFNILQARTKHEHLQGSQPVHQSLKSFDRSFHLASMKQQYKTLRGSHAIRKLKHHKKSQIVSHALLFRPEETQILPQRYKVFKKAYPQGRQSKSPNDRLKSRWLLDQQHSELYDHHFPERIKKPRKDGPYAEELIDFEQETGGEKDNRFDERVHPSQVQHHQITRKDIPVVGRRQREGSLTRMENIQKNEINGQTFVKTKGQFEESTHARRRRDLRLLALRNTTSLQVQSIRVYTYF